MSTQEEMKTIRKTATIVGVLFLIAMVTSLAGGGILESIIGAEDYLTAVSANETQVIIAVLLEIINCAAVVGIAAMMFPILKKLNEAFAAGYLGFRVTETVVLISAALIPLVMVVLSQEYVAAGSPDVAYFPTSGALLMESHAQLATLMTPVFFSLGAVLFYYLLYQSKLVPRFISTWGFIAVALMLIWNLLGTFGIDIKAGIVFGLPIILNEIFLGIWLIVKGFNSTSIVARSA